VLPEPARRPLLACGAELKNTFCVAKGQRVWVGHHIGDLENYETYGSFVEGIEHFKRLFAITPEVVVHDLHPEYLSTKYALDQSHLTAIGVQHHHAHLAAVLAEHGETGEAVGAIFDGTGLGTDGTVWGGELLVGDLCQFRRAGWLRPVRLAGGAQAIRQPWRMACAWMLEAGLRGPPVPLAAIVDGVAWAQVERLAGTGFASPVTTSMGRLFDAVAALCGVCPTVNYDGQAAIELEALRDRSERGAYRIAVEERDGALELDPREAIAAIVRDVRVGVPVGVVAARFHSGVAAATVEACAAVASATGVDAVVLSGGVFQNRTLLEGVASGLEGKGLRVRLPERLPANDGGICYGQAAVAARRMAGVAGG
jgi:hydrogenase maturation protein HypF